MATIELMKDAKGQFRFRVKAKNGEIIATSESYKQKPKALATIKALKSGAGSAKVVDLTAPKPATKKVAKPVAKVAAKKAKAPTKKVAAKPAPVAAKAAPKPAPKKVTKPAVKAAPKAAPAPIEPTPQSTPVESPAAGGTPDTVGTN